MCELLVSNIDKRYDCVICIGYNEITSIVKISYHRHGALYDELLEFGWHNEYL
jgi:hypothetical protein